MSEVSCFPYLWVSQNTPPAPDLRLSRVRMKGFYHLPRMLRGGNLHGIAFPMGMVPSESVAGMRYTTARMGRVLVARVDHGEDLLEEVQALLEKEKVTRGFMFFLGALSEGSLVTGPEEAVIPPVPHWIRFSGGWEMVGCASVYPSEGGPAIHLHAALGRGDKTLTGCLRERAETYLVVEVVVIELLDLRLRRERDEGSGLFLPDFDT